MENFAELLNQVLKEGDNFWDWLLRNVIDWSSARQMSAAAIILAIAWFFAGKSARWLDGWRERHPRKLHLPIYVTPRESFFLVYAAFALWVAQMISEGAGWPSVGLRTVSSLFIAWAVVRFTAGIIKSVFWSRLVAVILWTLAALNIVGWLGPAIVIMDKSTITIGSVTISMLAIFKSIAALGVLLWVVMAISHMLERMFQRSSTLTPSQKVLFYKLSSFSLYGLAFMLALNIAGIDLTALAVFSGALGLGIGIGLQNVFSNLISGIILLLDKSVKPGDVIAIGDTYGWVNSLGARCVSVLTRDGKEHLIPNANLISQHVENWSYSDTRIRVRIPIGIAYDSDLKKARELMLQAVKEHSRVLKYPAPNCLITQFGNNSIDHEIRIWVEDPANGLANIQSDIYYRMWELFTENGIVIPFQQQEVALKGELAERLLETLGQLPKKPAQ